VTWRNLLIRDPPLNTNGANTFIGFRDTYIKRVQKKKQIISKIPSNPIKAHPQPYWCNSSSDISFVARLPVVSYSSVLMKFACPPTKKSCKSSVYSSASLFLTLFSTVLVTHGQIWFENIKWDVPETMFLNNLLQYNCPILLLLLILPCLIYELYHSYA
jgi:hypothetical protein